MLGAAPDCQREGATQRAGGRLYRYHHQPLVSLDQVQPALQLPLLPPLLLRLQRALALPLPVKLCFERGLPRSVVVAAPLMPATRAAEAASAVVCSSSSSHQGQPDSQPAHAQAGVGRQTTVQEVTDK